MQLSILVCCSALILVFFLETHETANCEGNQITIVDKNKTFLSCSPCPSCPPGQQYTVPCKTTVIKGTHLNCVGCPQGKYSRRFNTKPCIHCTVCSKRHIKRTCTSFRNARCGDCLPGYYKGPVVDDCIECDKCCHDGKDVQPPGCKKVNMCKPRLHPCSTPVTPRRQNINPFKSFLDKHKATSLVKKALRTQMLVTTTTPSYAMFDSVKTPTQVAIQKLLGNKSLTTNLKTEKHYNLKNESLDAADKPVISKSQTSQSSSHIAIYILGSICVILVFTIGMFVYIKRKEKKTYSMQGFNRCNSFVSTPIEYLPTRLPKDKPLQFFVKKGGEVLDSVCAHLNSYRLGRYEFERMANRFSLTQTECLELRNMAMSRHGNATEGLLEILCAREPNLTVKQFATMAKNISRKDVYDMLEPFFEEENGGT